MPIFNYKGKTKGGGIIKGEIEALDIDVARSILLRQQLIILWIKKKSKEIVIPGFGAKVTEKDAVVFTRQLATMIDAGVPLVQCLTILANQSDNKLLAKTVNSIKTSVETGDTFSDALRKHPKIFDTLYTNMVEAGEIGGILDTILNRLAAYMEKSMALKKKIKSAMVYPIVILIVAVVVVAGLMIFVIPTFAKMFADTGGALPVPTLIVMKISGIFKNYTHYMVIIIATIIFLLRRYYKTEQGKLMIDTLTLKLPIAGLIVKVAVAKFTRTLGTLISSGVPIIEGLDITARTAGQKVVEKAIISTISSIKEGQTIATPLGKHKVFPPMVIQMIEIGEATGALDTMLNKIADFYDEEVDTAVEALTSLLEPALMVFLGVVIGGIVIAMYLPIFKMASAIG
ncbi:MAG: type II secretion system F family protein [Nitrospinae bacterium]|nr:type II secretion system F family protein [Nitrospinota bacterium]